MLLERTQLSIEDTMKYLCRFSGAAVLLAVGAAASVSIAGNKPLPDPADPAVPVPATSYQSELAPRPQTAVAGTPDQAWKANNAIVGSYDSMSPTAPTASHHDHSTATPAPDPHAHHKKKEAK